MRRPGPVERVAGWVAGRLLVVVARRASARGDLHEVLHCGEALEAGASGHPEAECSHLLVLDALARARRRSPEPEPDPAEFAPDEG